MSKKGWESRINYSMVPWIRENLLERDENQNRYINLMKIDGTDKNRYINWDINSTQSTFLNDIKISFRNNGQQQYIKLKFDINKNLSSDGKYNLARLLMLHMALKDCRNESNHASSKERATIEEVKQAIYAYVELTKKVIEKCSNQG